MKNVYHLMEMSELEIAQDNPKYSPPSLKLEGFVHLAFQHQLGITIKTFFKHFNNMYLLEISPESLDGEVRYEEPKGMNDDGDLHPHLYAPLNWSSVLRVYKLNIKQNGDYEEYKVWDKLIS